MSPADIVRADRLADLVCHDEQMTIWVGEVLMELGDHMRDPSDYEDVLDRAAAVRAAIRHVVEGAFAHPEILGLPARHG
ncbi:hypothetical protein RGUI_0830 [Rhodovulum sp. P5]|uniref:hypothetical protein n=1 Tax=Rhodovulum phage vB_RhkS_P1 TaxID=1873452 RepID=UPI00080AAED9|nr:hypothetical protein [Rhodovulum sp. P5]YP_009285917.1 hypothetical protein BI026_gp32 [Rhodovulum phage vB_RhkS_P1]ANT39903.1 hypothetical protein Rhks_32 [Rhodovulum phage vB_RhkS_P1]ARE38971.1 hypothetical protein RGUI_0830 [Rhodovulum sp. P5]